MTEHRIPTNAETLASSVGVQPRVLRRGEKVRVAEYKRPFTVRAANDRYAICTRPMFGTVLYFIADLKEGVRGTEGVVFEMGAETDEDCEAMLRRLSDGDTAVSRRNRVPLNFTV